MEKKMATHSSILAWRISGTEEPHGLPSMGSHRVGHDRSDLAAAAAISHEELNTRSSRLKAANRASQWLRKTKNILTLCCASYPQKHSGSHLLILFYASKDLNIK